jgi:DNA mismatch endonuclease, patch repair protein
MTEHPLPNDRPAPLDASVARRMSRQPRRDTAPEVALRRELHSRGMRFRVDWPPPGLPRRRADIAFTRRRVAVFVDGCFWHACPLHRTTPASNADWWAAKLQANVERDRDTDEHLRLFGWTVLRFWEHEDPVSAADVVEVAVRGRIHEIGNHG